MNTDYEQYLLRMEKIRRLSSPEPTAFGHADEYNHRLHVNFRAIGKFAEKNRLFIEKELNPLLDSQEPLTEGQAEELMQFCTSLMSAVECVNLDLPTAARLSKRLVDDAKLKGDLSYLIVQLDQEIGICYALMNMTCRITSQPEIADNYRKRGIKAGQLFLSLLRPETFEMIPDADCREMVLTNARYSVVFYEGLRGNLAANKKHLEILDQMLEIYDDPFYKKMVPDFDWDYFLFRTLEYFASTTDYYNRRGFSPEQLEHIYRQTKRFRSFWYSASPEIKEWATERRIDFLYARNQFLSGRISEYEYRHRLRSAFRKRNAEGYGTNDLFENLLIPIEYISLLHPATLTSEDKFILNGFYRDITAYILRGQNVGGLSFLLEFLSDIMEHFIEVPSGITFEDMALQCMAALHPPTYVHSLTVGQLTECLCGHIIEKQPEILIGVCGCQTKEDVLTNREKILAFAYHAAICHDFGKLQIIDTIFIYGRKLLDMEFDMIKQHPSLGYEMLLRHESTRDFADVARGHHIWYDNTRGYPDEFDVSKSPVAPIIYIVLCVDCLDAATDRIGRSYNKGKTLENFVAELREGSGTQYAPWLLPFFQDEQVYNDIKYLLIEGKKRNYRDTFMLLKDVQEKVR